MRSSLVWLCVASAVAAHASAANVANVANVPANGARFARDMDMAMDTDSSSVSADTDGASETPAPANESVVGVPHSMKHMHGMPILQTELTPEERVYWENYSTETYFNTPSRHRGALYAHVVLYVAAYVFLYPLVLVFWNTGHRMYLPTLTVHAALVVVLVWNYWVFAASIRPLYPHNAFHPMTLLLFLGTVAHWVVAAVAVASRYLSDDYDPVDADARDELLVRSPDLTLRELHSPFDEYELEAMGEPDGHLQTSNGAMLRASPPRLLQALLRFPAFHSAARMFGKSAQALTAVLNWALFAYFLVYFPTGVATYAVYGTDGTMFNLLAHFIKGGVFFVLGLVSLARYCGAFQDKGWAWNHRFVGAAGSAGWLRPQPRGLWTMEFVESALILVYGSTNIFLEHLAGAGGAWTAKDLQHVLIAFIYLGCGLCGVLLEYRLSQWRFDKAVDNLAASADAKMVAAVTKAHPGFSPNPFPILTIYWTGILMSKHEQASALSTDIHTQWGLMFVVGCAFRMVSYILLLLSPTKSRGLRSPQAPFSEVVTAFALLCGGLIFMESCDPVVHLFEYRGYTSMFTLNVSLGFVALIMAWEMAVFSIKDAIMARRRVLC